MNIELNLEEMLVEVAVKNPLSSTRNEKKNIYIYIYIAGRILDKVEAALVKRFPSLDLMMTSEKLFFRKLKKKLDLMNLF